MIGRLLSRLLAAQAGWAKPFGDFNVRWLKALFRPMRPIKDFLNGKWLGHSVHAALTDVPVGAFTLAIVFDVFNLRQAADVSIGIGILAMLAAAVAGAADYSDTDDDSRMVATVHSTLMVIGLVIYVISIWLRLAETPGADRLVPIVLSLVGYTIVTGAAWVGGENVYTLGTMVNRHAWRFFGAPKWQKLDITDIPEGGPTAAKAGTQSVVVFRQGDKVYALHAQCAHAGGPLAEGKFVDGCIECPWHFSRYDVATGRRKQGPTTFDQPRYELRPAEGGGWEALRVGGTSGQNL